MTKKELALRLGRNVSSLRQKKGFTQVHLGAISGVEQATIARIETGRANPTLDTISKLASAFEIDPVELFSR